MEFIYFIVLALALIFVAYRVSLIGHKVDNQLNSTVTFAQDQVKNSHGLVTDVASRLTSIEQTQRQVLGLTEQIRELEMIFKNPKRRGIIGEMMLAEQLREVMPADAYILQYRFPNGSIVDAVIKMREMIIPIDAKFPLENFGDEDREREFFRDVKLRIEETAQYILAGEKTSEFAFMYVPAEGVMEKLLEADIVRYAFERKVMLVSPLTFFAYLQTVIHGLNALKIEAKTKEVLVQLGKVREALSTWQDCFAKVGKNLDLASHAYEQANKASSRIDATITKLLD
ncbi:MAG: DNA recombination protein RmuC [Candidatus Abawacabacteria bacterium]|nr:DNA recombination protein RmuC [Candidatus Abawacabacteria bacterium]